MSLSNSEIKEIIDNNKVYIFELVKESIKECAVDRSRGIGIKVYINYESKIKAVNCPNESWSSAYIEHLLYYVDNKKWKEKFRLDERLGLIKSKVSEGQFDYFVNQYADEYEMDYEDALNECIKDNDWSEFHYLGDSEHYNKLVEEEFNKFLNTLDFSITKDLKVEVC